MALRDLIQGTKKQAVATATVATPATHGSETAGFDGSATATVATPATHGTGAPAFEAPATVTVATVHARRSWRITYPDRALTITCAPPATLADVQAMYPGASVAPCDPRPHRPATTTEAAELRALLARALPASTAAERAEAAAIGLADIEAALICWRAIAKAAKPPPSCGTCAHFRRPGTTVYCGGGREDLPRAYGQHHPLRRLPADGGASCTLWQQHPRLEPR